VIPYEEKTSNAFSKQLLPPDVGFCKIVTDLITLPFTHRVLVISDKIQSLQLRSVYTRLLIVSKDH